jgi:hypothetical protein
MKVQASTETGTRLVDGNRDAISIDSNPLLRPLGKLIASRFPSPRFPLFDPSDDLHSRLSARGAELEESIGKLDLKPGRHFAAIRRDVRGFIAESEAGRDVEALVEELLS